MSLLDDLLSRQTNRLLQLAYPNDDPPPSTLVVNALRGYEAMSRGFEYTAELLSEDAYIRLEDVQGKLLCVQLVTGDGNLRPFTGYVFSFKHVKTDGGWATYEAVLVPWIRYLAQRINTRVFLGQTVQQQIETVFADHDTLPKYKFNLRRTLPAMPMARQSDESDANYANRRAEAEGLHWSVFQAPDGHTLVFGDSTLDAPPIEGGVTEIRYHADGGSMDEDAIDTWTVERVTIPTTYGVAGIDFKVAQPVQETEISTVQQGDAPVAEEYRYEGNYGFRDAADAQRLARQRMEEIEARARVIHAEGNNRRVEAGRTFKLVDHFDDSGDNNAEFLIVEAWFDITNNYPIGQNASTEGAEPKLAEYRVKFNCLRKDVPWRPGREWNSTNTRLWGVQTATVIGTDGKPAVDTESYARVKVRFAWDREGTNTCWIRVASPWAGAQLGMISLPRVGSEVLTTCLDGDPDHPVATLGMFNVLNMPPFKLPDQYTLTSIRSRELTPDGGNAASGRSNHIVLDDTAGHMQVQVSTAEFASQLSIGSIYRIEDNAGRKEARGNGLELRTDGKGAVRAGGGMLVTTEMRSNAQGHITDMGETIERLSQATALQAALTDSAHKAQARDAGGQGQLVDAVKTLGSEIKGSGGDPAQGEFPELQLPHLVLASAAGIASTAERSTLIASNEHTALSSGGSTSVAAGMDITLIAKEVIRLLASEKGMEFIAEDGPIGFRVLKDAFSVLAKLSITQTADEINIAAKTKLTLGGGGSQIVLSAGGIKSDTGGPFDVHAASFGMSGGSSVGTPSLPEGVQLDKGNLQVLQRYVSKDGTVLQGFRQANFTASDTDGATKSGVLDSGGLNAVAEVAVGVAIVKLLGDPRDPWDPASFIHDPVWPPERDGAGDDDSEDDEDVDAMSDSDSNDDDSSDEGSGGADAGDDSGTPTPSTAGAGALPASVAAAASAAQAALTKAGSAAAVAKEAAAVASAVKTGDVKALAGDAAKLVGAPGGATAASAGPSPAPATGAGSLLPPRPSLF